jgi:hypothetical protein
LVSSQRFPHLWKKLWKIPEICATAQLFARFFGHFSQGEARKTREIEHFKQLVCLTARKSLITAGETVAEGRFC